MLGDLFLPCEAPEAPKQGFFKNLFSGRIITVILLICFSDNLSEMLGDLFLPCEAPEAPKQGFFKNLFSGGIITIILLICFSDNLSEMLGDLFLPCEAPEAPKQGFFKNLFSGGTSTLDREELCKYYTCLGLIMRKPDFVADADQSGHRVRTGLKSI